MHPYDEQNILKRIVRKELPCHLVYENDDVIAFMDIMPQSPGHCLVVPKEANTNLMTSHEYAAVAAIKVARRIASAAQKAFDASGVILTQYNGESAGQTIFHLHFHIIPVYQQALKHHARERASDDQLAQQAHLLKQALQAI